MCKWSHLLLSVQNNFLNLNHTEYFDRICICLWMFPTARTLTEYHCIIYYSLLLSYMYSLSTIYPKMSDEPVLPTLVYKCLISLKIKAF